MNLEMLYRVRLLESMLVACHTEETEGLLLDCLSDASLERQHQIFSVLTALDALSAPAILSRLIAVLCSQDSDLRVAALDT